MSCLWREGIIIKWQCLLTAGGQQGNNQIKLKKTSVESA